MFKDMSKRKKMAIGGLTVLVLVSIGLMIYYFGYNKSSDSANNTTTTTKSTTDFSTTNNIARSLINQEAPKSTLKNIVLKAMRQQEVPTGLYDDYTIDQLKDKIDQFIDKSSLISNTKSGLKDKTSKVYQENNPEKKQILLDLIKLLRLTDLYYKIKNEILPKVNLQLKDCKTSAGSYEANSYGSPLPYETNSSPFPSATPVSIESYSPPVEIATLATSSPRLSSDAEVYRLSSSIGSILRCIIAKEIAKPNPSIDILTALFLIQINGVCITRNILFSSVMQEIDNKWLIKKELKNEIERGAKDTSVNVNFDSPVDLKVIGQITLEYFKKRPPSANCELCKIPELED